ncbi:MAG: chemotaxis protein CheX [Candidatus Hydrogenedentes bacterium]|nr:chemotaxis protein CheX [Candidatus Hydrogenedentota bacterium]
MDSNAKGVLDDVFPRMLEELTFLFADPDDGSSPQGMPHDAVDVAIAFSGERNGTLDMGVSRSLGIEMASNLLGLDPDDDNAEHLGDDALRELMNVTCGHVLTSLAGDKPVFNLSIPTITALDGAGWDALARDADTARFAIDGRPVHLRLRVQS